MWEDISDQMMAAGYKFSPVQVENKYRGLERTFKQTKSHNQKTGRNKATCSYEKYKQNYVIKFFILKLNFGLGNLEKY